MPQGSEVAQSNCICSQFRSAGGIHLGVSVSKGKATYCPDSFRSEVSARYAFPLSACPCVRLPTPGILVILPMLSFSLAEIQTINRVHGLLSSLSRVLVLVLALLVLLTSAHPSTAHTLPPYPFASSPPLSHSYLLPRYTGPPSHFHLQLV